MIVSNERSGKIIPVIHRNSRFNRSLRSLKRAGGTAARAADCAEAIIKRLSSLDGSLARMGKLTRNGEARIKNCIKFDLGGGYRLLCLKTSKYFLLLFAGTHDDCDRWIVNNRESLRVMEDSIKKIPLKPKPAGKIDTLPEERETAHDYEDILLEKISERDLRWIFSGLCR